MNKCTAVSDANVNSEMEQPNVTKRDKSLPGVERQVVPQMNGQG